MNWYYVEFGKQAGPVDDATLEQLREAGRITTETLIWREGMPQWLPYSQAKADERPSFNLKLGDEAGAPPRGGAQSAPGTVPEAVCTECNRIYPTDTMIRYGEAHVCVNCKPKFMQKLSEGARIAGVTGMNQYAGFWIRFVAKFLDGLILGAVVFLPLFLVLFFVVFSAARNSQSHFGISWRDSLLHASSAMSAIPLVVNLFVQAIVMGARALYDGFFIGKYGATPGKMICRLKVVDANGGPVTYGRAFGRAFAEILSQMVCDIGYIIAAFDDQKRTLHDHICGTRVVYK